MPRNISATLLAAQALYITTLLAGDCGVVAVVALLLLELPSFGRCSAWHDSTRCCRFCSTLPWLTPLAAVLGATGVGHGVSLGLVYLLEEVVHVGVAAAEPLLDAATAERLGHSCSSLICKSLSGDPGDAASAASMPE